MTTKSMRRKKSSLTEVKIAVLGAPDVGKSALIVRFLTRRYIGEYDHQSENRYKSEVLVDGEPVLFEVLEPVAKADNELPSIDLLNWADGLLLVYSITDRESFNYVRRIEKFMSEMKNMPLFSIVANKSDMVHLRQVSREEGEILAHDCECPFDEVAAAEEVTTVAAVFHEICRQVLQARRKSKQSLLDRMLGTKGTVGRIYARGKSDSALPKEIKE